MGKMNTQKETNEKSIYREEKDICPNCGSSKIERVNENYTFTYGAGDDAVDISAIVPIIKCGECGEGFLDYVAEDICHEAICQHLGVMTPSQIKGLRKLYKLTQAEFAEITKLGEATLSRWERGIVIQNQAYDNYLYLLGFKENLQRIHRRKESTEKMEPSIEEPERAQFRELEVNEEVLQKQGCFKLRRA